MCTRYMPGHVCLSFCELMELYIEDPGHNTFWCGLLLDALSQPEIAAIPRALNMRQTYACSFTNVHRQVCL